MKYALDLLAILLMGDGLSKLVSPKAHNRFYQHPKAPKPYNRFLQYLYQRPPKSILLSIGMIATGALLSRYIEHKM